MIVSDKAACLHSMEWPEAGSPVEWLSWCFYTGACKDSF